MLRDWTQTLVALHRQAIDRGVDHTQGWTVTQVEDTLRHPRDAYQSAQLYRKLEWLVVTEGSLVAVGGDMDVSVRIGRQWVRGDIWGVLVPWANPDPEGVQAKGIVGLVEPDNEALIAWIEVFDATEGCLFDSVEDKVREWAAEREDIELEAGHGWTALDPDWETRQATSRALDEGWIRKRNEILAREDVREWADRVGVFSPEPVATRGLSPRQRRVAAMARQLPTQVNYEVIAQMTLAKERKAFRIR